MIRGLFVAALLVTLTLGGLAQTQRQATQRLDSLKVELEAKRQKLDHLGKSEGNVLGNLQDLE